MAQAIKNIKENNKWFETAIRQRKQPRTAVFIEYCNRINSIINLFNGVEKRKLKQEALYLA